MIKESELKIGWSYSFDIPEWLQKSKMITTGNIIGVVIKQTKGAIQIKELFGYQRVMWFPRSQIALTPQISIEQVV